jgi:hypothetical protein
MARAGVRAKAARKRNKSSRVPMYFLFILICVVGAGIFVFLATKQGTLSGGWLKKNATFENLIKNDEKAYQPNSKNKNLKENGEVIKGGDYSEADRNYLNKLIDKK